MNAPEIFSVAQHERTSALWRALHEHYTARLAVLRSQNDHPNDAERTAFKRGQIAEAKAFLALADEPVKLAD